MRNIEKYLYENKIGDNKNNVELLEKIVRGENQIILIDAPCGAGKTYICDYLFSGIKKEYTKKGKKFLNTILCPTRIQNIQNSNKYDFKHLIKESSSRKIEFDTNYSCVYELFSKIVEFILEEHKKGEEFLCNIIIDEAQELLNERGFREGVKALTSQLEMLRQMKIVCNIIYLSGTTEGLLGMPEGINEIFNFDRIISFRSSKKEIKAKNLNIHVCDKDENFYDYITSSLVKQENNLTHLQNKKGIARIKKTFEKTKKVSSLTSDDKSYTYKTNEEGTEMLVCYDNKLLKNITEEEKVVDGLNIATSCIESGTNNVYAPEGFAQNYICLSESDCQIESIIQFFNRTRCMYQDMNVYLKKSDVEKEILSREEIRECFLRTLNIHVDRVKKYIEFEKNSGADENDIYNNVVNYLKIMQYGKEKAGFRGVISVNENLDLTIDMLSFEDIVYKEYSSRYYYNPEKLAEKITEKINVENINFYGNIEIIQKCAKLEDTEVDKKKIALEALDSFDEIDIKQLEKVSKGIADIKTNEKINNFLSYRPYKELLERLLFFGMEINEVLKDISKHRNEKNLKKVNKKYKKAMYIYLNKRYIESAKTKVIDLASVGYEGFYMENGKDYSSCEIEVPESEVVLKNLYIINDAGNLKQTTITPKLLHNITTEINNYSEKYFTDEDTLKLIMNHFWLRADKKDASKFKVVGLIEKL